MSKKALNNNENRRKKPKKKVVSIEQVNASTVLNIEGPLDTNSNNDVDDDDDEYKDILSLENYSLNPCTDNPLFNRNITIEIIASFMHNTTRSAQEKVQVLVNEAHNKINNGFILIDSSDIPLEIILTGFIETVKNEISCMTQLLRNLPVFCDFDSDDILSIIKNKFFNYAIIKYHGLKINNQNYFILKNGLQFTRENMNKVSGIDMINMKFKAYAILNELKLNQNELSALMIFLISYPKNLNHLKEINQLIQFSNLAGKVLAHELFQSKRNRDYIEKLRKVNFISSTLLLMDILFLILKLIITIEKVRMFELRKGPNKLFVSIFLPL